MHGLSKEKNINYCRFLEIINFHQMLVPEADQTSKIWGYNAYHVGHLFFVSIELMVLSFCIIGIYYWANDLYAWVQFIPTILSCGMTALKIVRFIRKSNTICECFDVMGDDYFSGKQYRKDIMLSYKRRSTVFSNSYAIVWFCLYLLWLVNPIYIRKFPVENLHGEIVVYRNTILNILFRPVSFAHFNQFYALFYTIEALTLTHVLMGYVMFDIFIANFCWIILARLKTIEAKFTMFGHQDTNGRDNDVSVEDLRLIITDLQKVINTIKMFFDVVKPITVAQLGCGSNIFIVLTYMSVLNYFNGETLTSTLSLKLMASALLVLFQVFLLCYFHGLLDNQMNSMIFALYCSNWITMDLRFKKLLLFTMTMNRVQEITIRITPLKTVNLLLFTGVLNVSYSIISVLVKQKLTE